MLRPLSPHFSTPDRPDPPLASPVRRTLSAATLTLCFTITLSRLPIFTRIRYIWSPLRLPMWVPTKVPLAVPAMVAAARQGAGPGWSALSRARWWGMGPAYVALVAFRLPATDSGTRRLLLISATCSAQ